MEDVSKRERERRRRSDEAIKRGVKASHHRRSRRSQELYFMTRMGLSFTS
jgi:hypothetical protein